MAATTCWHCHELAQMVFPQNRFGASLDPFGNDNPIVFPDLRFIKPSDDSGSRDLYVYSCVNCGYPNIAEVEMHSIDEMTDNGLGNTRENHIVRWLPIEPLGKIYPNVPQPIASAANEVHKCMEIGARRAAVVMARTTLEGIVTEQEETPSKKKLYERIKNLETSGKITSRTANAATAIRLCGNDYAHNALEPVDDEYVKLVIQILDSIIEDLYSYPNLVERATNYALTRREARKEANHGEC